MQISFLEALTERFNRAGAKPDGRMALHHAVRAGNLRDVKQQLRGRADVNRADDTGMTPLHIAAYWGEAGIVSLLLANNADVNARDDQGWTPLHAAAMAGGQRTRKNIIAALLAKGADDNLADNHGWTARDYMALWDENPAAAEKLRQFLKSAAKLSPPRPN